MKKIVLLLLMGYFSYAQQPEHYYPQTQFDSDTCCWRKISAEGKHHESAELIVNYIKNSQNAENKQSLNWHAGQMYAMAGEGRQAVKYIKKTYDSFYKWLGGEDGKGWYYFAKGTVAFIERDKEKLERIITYWKKELPLDNNYEELVTLYNNWDKEYKDAYL
ncbi:hypothetical protein [Flavobacterium sp.]|uniref:hypothetical protein n=1 Tax=Flavobacterium sp. TaxID=239 RepID=UPI004033DFB5